MKIKNVRDHPTKENIDKTEPNEDEHDREQLGDDAVGRDVSVTDGAHRDDAKVEPIDDGMGLIDYVVVTVQRVDKHA